MMDIKQTEWGPRHCDADTGLIGPLLNLRAVTTTRGKWIARWLKFNAVGAIGIGIQLAALTLLARVLGLSIIVATGLAVETAIIHNFAWHHSWTWADRRCGRFVEVLRTLLRFNLTNGLVSLIGNMFLTPVLAGPAGIGLLKANLIAIATCSLANFILSDRFVFIRRD